MFPQTRQCDGGKRLHIVVVGRRQLVEFESDSLRTRSVLALLLPLLLFPACNRDKVSDTAIIAGITRDLVVPGEINQVNLKAKDPQGGTIYDHTFNLGEGTNRTRLPFRSAFFPLQDKQVAEQHAAISESRGQFAIEPLQGSVKIEDKAASSRQPLGDRDTIEIGESRFVFKCVTTGNLG